MVEKKNEHLRDPHERISELGDLKIIARLNTSKKYPKTCAAMDKVSKEEERDDKAKRSGEDDYTASLMKLLHAFDTFIHEKYGGDRSTNSDKNYKNNKPCHLTIWALWQIRHVQTHGGSVIDGKCTRTYGDILAKGKEKKTTPVIDLPDSLQEGMEFTLGFEDYRKVKECVISYIKSKVSRKDFDIIRKRASITNLRFTELEVIVDYGFAVLAIKYTEAYKHGCKIDPESKILEYPGTPYFIPNKEVIKLDNGEEIKVRILKRRY